MDSSVTVCHGDCDTHIRVQRLSSPRPRPENKSCSHTLQETHEEGRSTQILRHGMFPFAREIDRKFCLRRSRAEYTCEIKKNSRIDLSRISLWLPSPPSALLGESCRFIDNCCERAAEKAVRRVWHQVHTGRAKHGFNARSIRLEPGLVYGHGNFKPQECTWSPKKNFFSETTLNRKD